MGITSSEVFTADKAAAMAILRNSVTTLQLPLLLFLQLFISSSFAAAAIHPLPLTPFNRSSFPPGFVFGAASSAYQYEGAAFEDGKGASVWDTFTHKSPERILDKSNGDVANDFYHRYKEDVKLVKYVGLDAFRLSISWPRILPRGKLSGGVNRQGIAFYNNVINELLANGVTPFVTLFHWDTPQALEDEYGGFLSAHIIDDFKDFVDVCFKEFGDRVKYWITLNEPVSYANGGYDGGLVGHFAPGRCSDRSVCPAGDSATEPYIVAHHLLLSHATAVKLYKDKYQGVQKGEIGITVVTHWFLPYTNSKLDAAAVGRSLDFVYGWFISPITYGDYPSSMRSIVGHRLPKFTKEQSAMLKGSFDFLGLNYYTAFYVAHVVSTTGNLSNSDDRKANFISERNGVAIGEPTGVSSFYIYPEGLYNLLVYTKEKYNNPKIYITENGIGDQNNATTKESITDPQRIAFYHRHLQAVLKAMKDGVNLKGFIAWSFLDVFEWNSGFTLRFGLCYVDWKNGLKRIPKQSAIWFRNFLGKK